jgi:hypothetical protein
MLLQRVSRAGLSVAKIGQPGPLATRFGSFEVADIRLSQLASDGNAASERACLASRLVDPKLSLEIAGLACGPAAKPIDRRSLGCILDRLDYLSNGANKGLDEFFLHAELARGQGCAGATMSPNAAKSSWLDGHSNPPPLKPAAHPAKKAKAAR